MNKNREGQTTSSIIVTINRVLGWFLTGLIVILFCFFATLAAIRFIVFPNIDYFQPNIAAFLSESVGVRITFDDLDATWHGLDVVFVLKNVQAFDQDGARALILDRVNMVVSWETLFRGKLILKQLSIGSPTVHITRISPSLMYIGGFKIDSSTSDSTAREWFLLQKQVLVQNATLYWQDLTRLSPPLTITQLDFVLENRGRRHRFALRHPEQDDNLKSLDVRGELRGRARDDLRTWRGRIYANVQDIDLAAWREWIDYPIDLTQGKATGEFWLSFQQGTLSSLEAITSIENVRIAADKNLRPIEVVQAETQLIWLQKPDHQVIDISRLNFQTKEGRTFAPDHFKAAWRPGLPDGSGFTGRFTTQEVDIGALAELARYLPLPLEPARYLAGMNPKGYLEAADVTWQVPTAESEMIFRTQVKFKDLSVTAFESIPGLSNATGQIDGNQMRGKILLAVNNGSLSLPEFFDPPTLALTTMTANAGWVKENDRWRINLTSLTAKNSDLTGQATGSYWLPTNRAGDEGDLDLNASINALATGKVPRYLPTSLGTTPREWIAESLKGGQAKNIRFRIKGPVALIPFPGGRDGLFNIALDVEGTTLTFDEDWPAIERLTGQVQIANSQLTVSARGMTHNGVPLNATATIDHLLAENPQLHVEGQAKGPTADFLAFIEETPLKETAGDLIEETVAKGNAQLALTLDIPLSTPDQLQLEGMLGLRDSCLFLEGFPAINEVAGRAQFTQDGITRLRMRGNTLGGHIQVSGRIEDEILKLQASGSSSVEALLDWVDLDLENRVSGMVTWRGTVFMRDEGTNMVLMSDLLGLEVDFPPPLKKQANESVNLIVDRMMIPGADGAWKEYRWRLALGAQTQAQWYQRADTGEMTRGKVFFGFDAKNLMERSRFPDRGFLIGGRLEYFDVNEWLAIADSLEGILETNDTSNHESMPLQVNLGFKELVVFDRPFNDLILRTQVDEDELKFRFTSETIEGELSWQTEGKGTLVGRFTTLSVPPARRNEAAKAPEETAEALESLPSLDFKVDELLVEGKTFGRVEIRAINQADVWEIERFYLQNKGGKINATGRWSIDETGERRTSLNFNVDVITLEDLLPVTAIDDQIDGGRGEIEGFLSWVGPPTAPDYPSISGEMSVKLERGSIIQADPGFLGKMLGLFTLRSILTGGPIKSSTFDKGFEFNTLEGKVKATDGVIRTNDRITIDGPVGRVNMTGKIDLNHETIDMKVRVLPALTDSVSAIVAYTINPFLFPFVYAIQKAFQDPLSHVLQVEYDIVGPLSNPEVKGIAQEIDSDEVL